MSSVQPLSRSSGAGEPAAAAAWMRIGELSERVGVSVDRLRVWERRYGLITPRRTRGGQRMYSTIDEARVRLMLRYLARGLSPRQAAEEVSALRLSVRAGAGTAIEAEEVAAAYAEMRASLDLYDETGAQRVLERLFLAYAPVTVLRDVVLPYLAAVGSRWADGHLSVAQEHFASNFLQARLLALARGWDRGLGPRALLACAPGEQHTFGLVSFGIALHRHGWRITYLGADTPLEMTEQAAGHISPELIVVSAAMPERLEGRRDALARLAGACPCVIAGAGGHAALIGGTRVRLLEQDPITAADELGVPA
jgi:MerR family transcriptional regulator, light-induced transcriptional regulator